MIADKALANCRFLRNMQGGDTGKRRVEHRSFNVVMFTHFIETGYARPDYTVSIIGEFIGNGHPRKSALQNTRYLGGRHQIGTFPIRTLLGCQSA